MESYSLTCASPDFSQKRTSSPGAPAPHTKRAKTEPEQIYSKKDKRRRRKKKKPIIRNSGLTSGLVQDVRFTSLSPEPPVPSSSYSYLTKDCSPPVAKASSSTAAHILLREEDVVEAPHSESKPLRDHKALLASLVPSLVCQICLDLLHKPFALSPCGHVSCYGCLVNWFNVNQQPHGREGGHIYSKKTCPQCRATVRGRPIEAWNVKDMVAAVSKSGLAQDFPQPEEVDSPEAASADPEFPSRDPWANVFPPMPSRPGSPPVEGSPSAFGMYDVEDQVHRCLDCMHEIWGGLCSQCGRHYSGHDVDAPDDEASDGEHAGIWSILPAMEQIIAFSYGDNVHESDNGSYESSFIDDSDSDSERHDGEAVGISSDGNDDSIIEVTALTTTVGRDEVGRTQIAFSEDGQDGDENGNDIGGTDESQTVRRRPRRRQVLSDSDVDESGGYSAKSEDDGSLSRPPMRLFGRRRGRHSLGHETKDESVNSRSTESDDSEDVGLGDRAFGVQWSGSESGAFAATKDNSDDDEEGW